MRKIIVCTMLVLVTAYTFSQETNPGQAITRQDYLTKSKSQKTAAWILLGAGATVIAIAAPGNVSFDILPVLAVGGTLSILGSIPLFIASARNKRKAMNASTFLEIRKHPFPRATGMPLHSFLNLSLRVNL